MRWPWPEEPEEAGDATPAPAGPGDGKSKLRRGVEYAAAWAAIVAAAFLFWPIVAGACAGAGSIELEVDELDVSNPPTQLRSIGSRGSVQTPGSEPKLVATIRNRGEETAFIEEARITVVEGARLNVCVRQGGDGGDVPRSKDYGIVLPEFPGEEPRVIRRDLHIEVQPGHGVRPVLSVEKADLFASGLFALAVEYVADPGGEVLEVGRFVLGVPGPVERYGVTLPENEEMLSTYGELIDTTSTWCYRHNLAAVRRVIAEPGVRAPEIRALDHLRLAPSWPELADRRPVREVVPDLLASESSEGFMYAVEAARLSGDSELVAEVEDEAVALLLEMGRERLAESPRLALADAERVLSLRSSPQARRLLWEARAAWSAEEARDGAEASG